MNGAELRAALGVAIEAAKAGGETLKSYAGRTQETLGVRAKSSPRDVVTEADEAAQREIVRIISAAYPSHRIIGEEAGAEQVGDPASPYAWTVDPLDGTTNFIHGKPTMGPMLALLENGRAVLGVIHRPFMGDVFHAVEGGGAFRDGAPLTLRATRGMDDAIVCMNLRRGQPSDDGTVSVRIPVCASVENYGCAVESFVQVLLGHNDGVMYDGPHAWDVAPGCLLIAEAGGFSRWELKDPADPRGSARCAAASTKEVFDVLEAFTFGQA